MFFNFWSLLLKVYIFAVVTFFFLPSGYPQYQYPPPPILVGWDNFQFQILKRGDQKTKLVLEGA